MNPDLLPVLRRRWSPRSFDPTHRLDDESLDVLLEAARWAPSAGNSQPWAFHATRRDELGWSDIVGCLAGSSRAWAVDASVLLVNLAHSEVEDTGWSYSEFAEYDLGQSVAHMTIQAHAMGLACRQFRAFDLDSLSRVLDVPAHWRIVTMTAIGNPSPDAVRDAGSAVRDTDVTWPRAEG